MRQAFIIESFADAYKKLLKNTLFMYLDSHWFVSRDGHGTELYIIRIKEGHDDIEYSIQNFGSNFEVVTDSKEVAILLTFMHQLFNTIDSKALDLFNNDGAVKLNLFSNCSYVDNIELDKDGTFKVQVNA